MTWGNFLVKSLSLIVLLPLILSKLDTSDIVVWYLFLSLITLQMLMDLGFTPTFTRIIAYGMGGIAPKELNNIRKKQPDIKSQVPNWDTIIQVGVTMKFIYKRLSIIVFIIALSLGSLSVSSSVSESTNPDLAWIAWLVVVFTTIITLYGNYYQAYLQGINEVARIQRWQMFFVFASVVTSSVVLSVGGGLLALTLSNQVWLIANVAFNRWLKNTVHNGLGKAISQTKQRNPHIWKVVWPAAWRSGIGVFMSIGLINISGIIYAQLTTTDEVASYLLGLQIARTIINFSAAPFYSKIPVFSKLYAQQSWNELIKLAAQRMSISYWVFVIAFIFFGIMANELLDLVGSNVDFPGTLVWCLFGAAFFFERYGAMHIQLYSTSNHIIWHIANGISGIIIIVLSILLFPFFKIMAFPLSLLVGYLGFYSWYAVLYSYRKFNLSFLSFDKSVMLPPLLVFIIYSGTQIYIDGI